MKITWTHSETIFTGRAKDFYGRFVLERYKAGEDLYRVLLVKYLSHEEDESFFLTNGRLVGLIEGRQCPIK